MTLTSKRNASGNSYWTGFYKKTSHWIKIIGNNINHMHCGDFAHFYSNHGYVQSCLYMCIHVHVYGCTCLFYSITMLFIICKQRRIKLRNQVKFYIFEFSKLCFFFERFSYKLEGRMLSDISMNSGDGFSGKTVTNICMLL